MKCKNENTLYLSHSVFTTFFSQKFHSAKCRSRFNTVVKSFYINISGDQCTFLVFSPTAINLPDQKSTSITDQQTEKLILKSKVKKRIQIIINVNKLQAS